jgi:hypothetical protein
MIKFQKRTILGIVILFILGASPLSITYSFGEDYRVENEKDIQNPEKTLKKGRLSVILTEKIVNGRLEVQHYTVPEEITEDDKQRMLSFEGETSGWAYVNYKAYHAGITLFDGKATKVGENMWQKSTNDMLKIENGEIEPKISEKNDNSDQVMNGSALEETLSYKVIFSGKFTETEYENVLITSFIKSGLNSETSQNIKLLQIGEITNNSEKLIVSYQDFRNSILIS